MVVHRDREHLGEEEIALIATLHPDAVGRLELEIWNGAQTQLVFLDFKGGVIGSAGAGDQAISEVLGREGAVGIGAAKGAHQAAGSHVFNHAAGTEADVGGRFIHIENGDRQHLLHKATALIGAAHPDAVAALGLEIGATGDAQLIAQDVEGAVVGGAATSHQAISERITGILVGAAEAADHRARGYVLIDAVGTDRQVSGGIVEVVDGNREHLFSEQTALIGAAQPQAVAALGFEVGGGIKQQLVGDHREGGVVAIARAAHQAVGEALGCGGAVGIEAAEAAEHQGRASVFVHRATAAQGQIGGCLVDVVDADAEHLLEAQPALVGAAHPDAVAVFGFEVGAGIDLQLIAQDVEGAVVGGAAAGHQAVGEGITCILVGAAEAPDHRARGYVFIQAAGAEIEICGGLVEVVDGDDESLFKTASALISGANADEVAVFGFEIRAGVDAQLVVGDGEGVVVRISGPGNKAVSKGVANIGIRGAEASD